MDSISLPVTSKSVNRHPITWRNRAADNGFPVEVLIGRGFGPSAEILSLMWRLSRGGGWTREGRAVGRDVPLDPKRLSAQSQKRRDPSRRYSARTYQRGIRELVNLGLLVCTFKMSQRVRRFRLTAEPEDWVLASKRVREGGQSVASLSPTCRLLEQPKPKEAKELAHVSAPPTLNGSTYKTQTTPKACSEQETPIGASVPSQSTPEEKPRTPTTTPPPDEPHRRPDRPPRPRPPRRRRGGGLYFPAQWTPTQANELREIVRRIARRDGDGRIYAATNARLRRFEPTVLLGYYRESTCSEIRNPGGWLRDRLDKGMAEVRDQREAEESDPGGDLCQSCGQGTWTVQLNGDRRLCSRCAHEREETARIDESGSERPPSVRDETSAHPTCARCGRRAVPNSGLCAVCSLTDAFERKAKGL